jgi:hypothetical protein
MMSFLILAADAALSTLTLYQAMPALSTPEGE